MSLEQYVAHYLAIPQVGVFALVSFLIAAVMHVPIYVTAGRDKEKLMQRLEMFYEMIYSATAMLFFIGLYFLVSYRYFTVSEEFYRFWNRYEDVLLLAALVLSIVMINVIDHVLVPLRTITRDERASLRMMAMLYMLLVFAYIKYVYLDNNYDEIIAYFIIMVIGRFVYFDASFRDFLQNMKNLLHLLPILVLAGATSGLLALYGFHSGYLLKKNGVVLSLGIAHVFVILFISIFHHILRRVGKHLSHEEIVEDI